MTFFDAWFASGIRVATGLTLVAIVVRLIRPVFDKSFQARTFFVVCLFGLLSGFCWIRLPITQPGFALFQTQLPWNAPASKANKSYPVAKPDAAPFDSPAIASDPGTMPDSPAGHLRQSAAEKSIEGAEPDPKRPAGSQTGKQQSSAILSRFSVWCFLFWSSGLICIATKMFLDTKRLKRRLIHDEDDVSQTLFALVNSIPEQLHEPDSTLLSVHQRTRIRVSGACGAPLLVGVWRPTIWLPTWIESLEPQRQQAVILHELAHVARRDIIWTAVAVTSCLLNFFHPAVWWLQRQLASSREHAADRWAIDRLDSATVYANALLDVAARTSDYRGVSALAMTRHGESLKERILGAIAPHSVHPRRSIQQSFALLIAAGIFLPCMIFLLFTPPNALSQDPVPASQQPVSGIFPAESSQFECLQNVQQILGREPFQHFHEIQNARWIDDEQFVVSDRSGLSIWNADTQELVKRISSDGMNYNFVDYSRATNRLAVFGRKLSIHTFPEMTLENRIDSVELAIAGADTSAFSPDGRYLAVTGKTSVNHGWLKIIDCDTGTITFERGAPRMHALAWDRESRFVAVGEDRGIVVFFTPDGRLIRPGIRLEPNENPRSLDFSPDGNDLVICSDSTLWLFRIASRQKIWARTVIDDNAETHEQLAHVRFGRNGTRLMVSTHHGRGDQYQQVLKSFNTETGAPLAEQVISSARPRFLEFSPDRTRLVVPDRQHSACLVDSAGLKPIIKASCQRGRLNGDRNFPVSLAVEPAGRSVLVVDVQKMALWDLEQNQRRWAVDRPDWLMGADWSSDGNLIAVSRDGNSDGDDDAGAWLEIVSPADGAVVSRTELPDQRGGPVRFLADDRILACSKQHAVLFDTDLQVIWSKKLVDGHAFLGDAAVSGDDRFVAIMQNISGGGSLAHSGYSQGSVMLLKINSGEVVHELRCPVTPERVYFSADDKLVLASTNNHPKRIRGPHPLVVAWTVNDGRPAIPSATATGAEFDYERLEPSRFGLHPEEDISLEEHPFLATQRKIVRGYTAMDPSRSLIAIDKPIENTEYQKRKIPSWSSRLLIRDLARRKTIGQTALPGFYWDTAALPDGRWVALNSNGAVLVLRKPEEWK